ncbi:MAG: leucine-rich repeat protein [Lachnospiraceae bacterium]|nr:leucine-rich repeat protein [Lachnospiraceae bacterium]
MKKRIKRRILSVVLSAAMLLTSTPVYADVMAEPIDPEVGLCEHHTEHEEWCSYVAPTPGTPCGHEHDEACYREVLTCGLEEDVTATDGNSAHIHDDECYELEVDCHHEHDDECGYVEASAGAECEFTCAECIALEELGGEGEGVSPWVINDRFAVDGLCYKEIGPGKAQVYAVDEDTLDDVAGAIQIESEVTDPETLEEYTITSIAEGVFKDNDDIVSVTFAEEFEEDDAIFQITKIEDEMFAGCRNLTSVTYPNTVTSIGDGAFEGCKSLKEIEIPNEVTSLGDGVFKNCTKLESVDLGNITILPAHTFEGCSSLESIDISGLLEIGDYAFYNCSKLTAVDPNTFLGDGLTTIGGYAFANCIGLEDGFLDRVLVCDGCDVEYWDEYDDYYGQVCAECLKSVMLIPNSIESIGTGAFDVTDSTDIVTKVVCTNDSATGYAYRIADMIANASNGFCSLICIENSVALYNSFYTDCYIVDSDTVYAPDSEGYYKSYEIEYVYKINEYASYDKAGKAELISVEYLPEDCDAPQPAYLEIYVWGPVQKYDTYGNLYDYQVTGISNDFNIDLYDIPYDVYFDYEIEYIGNNAFKDESNLMNVYINTESLAIGESAFENCTSLSGIEPKGQESLLNIVPLTSGGSNFVIPQGIHTIGDRAFAGCDYFYEVEIPYSVENMGKEVFAECGNLQYVTFANPKYIELDRGTSVDYENTKEIVMVPEGMFKDCKNLIGVKIPDTVTEIGASAFENCREFYMLLQYENYKDEYGNECFDIIYNEDDSVPECTLPSTITTIGSRAFYRCTKWNTVYAGENITSVGTNAFSKGTRFITDSSIVQLMLVASIDNNTIPETSWDGFADVEPGAIVTVDDGAMLTGDIGQNAEVTIPAGSSATINKTTNETTNETINETINLAKDATLYVSGSLALNGTIAGPNEGYATIYIPDLSCVTGEGGVTGNINLITTLKSSMIQLPDVDEYAHSGEEIKPTPTVTVKFGGQTFVYIEDTDYEVTYSNNISTGTATVIVTVKDGGNLLGRTARKNFTIGKATPTVTASQPTIDKTNVTITAEVSGGVGSGYDGTMTIQVLQDNKVKLVKNIQMDGSSTSVEYTWNNLYNGNYTVKAIYNGDRYHTSATSANQVEFTINVAGNDAPLGTGGSGGSGGGGGGGGTGGGSTGGQAPAIPDPNTNPNNSEPIDWGVITLDPVKGYVSSNYGIMARDSQDKHSTWKVDEISALIWGGNKDDYWQLQYPNGSVAKGSTSVDENGQPKENYLWEQDNGKWWVFDSKGYAKMGWVFDPNYQAWFYVHVKHGMMTGWIQIDNLWYYLHEVSDGRKGCMYAATRTPDGYYVREDGSWDGKPKQ